MFVAYLSDMLRGLYDQECVHFLQAVCLIWNITHPNELCCSCFHAVLTTTQLLQKSWQ